MKRPRVTLRDLFPQRSSAKKSKSGPQLLRARFVAARLWQAALSSGCLCPAELTKPVSLCGSFGRACVQELMTRGTISKLTVEMTRERTCEAGHISDHDRHLSLARRGLNKLAAHRKFCKPFMHFLLLCKSFDLTGSEREKIHAWRQDPKSFLGSETDLAWLSSLLSRV